jgi:hypothetical protein
MSSTYSQQVHHSTNWDEAHVLFAEKNFVGSGVLQSHKTIRDSVLSVDVGLDRIAVSHWPGPIKAGTRTFSMIEGVCKKLSM